MNKIKPAKCPFFLSAYANAEPPIIYLVIQPWNPQSFHFSLRELLLLLKEFLLPQFPHSIDQN